MSPLGVELIATDTGETCSASLNTNLSPEEILAVEKVWGTSRIEAVLRLVQSGVPWSELPEHWHWNWANKVSGYFPLAHRFLGIVCGGETQGMARVDLATHFARLPGDVGKPLVYVDFLESAPWNARAFTAAPKFKLTGFRLMEAVVQLSFDEGFFGRVGLHALPQAASFYERACGMVDLGLDPQKENLAYFELSRDAAARWIGGGL